MLLQMSSPDCGLLVAVSDRDQDLENFSSDVALQGAHGFAFRLSASEGLHDVPAGFLGGEP